MSYEPSDFNDRHFTTDNTGLPDGEYRYHHNSIHQDAASGQAQQAAADTAAAGNLPVSLQNAVDTLLENGEFMIN